jgi:hypothetical protein
VDWKIVKNTWTHKPIGAVGFVGDEIAVIVAFYDDKDANHDGRVSLSERFLSMFSMQGRALAEVANHAYADPDILTRDPSIYQLRGQLTAKFASGLVAEGIYKAWFSQGIGQAAGAIAGQITQNMVGSYVIKRGLEKAVALAYREGFRRN